MSRAPACPFCGSSATLPFEHEERPAAGHALADVALGVLAFLLALLALLLFFLLSRASWPPAFLLLLALLLFWRQRRRRPPPAPPGSRCLCLDCNRSFTLD